MCSVWKSNIYIFCIAEVHKQLLTKCVVSFYGNACKPNLLSAILAWSSVASYECAVFFRNYVTNSKISGEKLSAIEGMF